MSGTFSSVRALRLSLVACGSTLALLPGVLAAQVQDTVPENPATEGEGVIIVSGQRAAIESAAQEEREADTFTSIVTADDIGQFGDPTVAESLQRIPGVSINREGGEGQQVSIRGLPTQFATVTVDGARLGSSDPEINSTNLDFFAADNLSSIEVVKVLIPEYEADAIAGSVNLRTISAFARGENSIGGRVEIGYQEKAEAWNPEISGEFTRLINAGDSRIGIAASASFQRRETITDSSEVGDGLVFFLLNDDDGDLEYIQGGDADNCQDGDLVVECYLLPAELDLRSEEQKRDRYSLSGQIEWDIGDHLLALRGTYSRSDEQAYTNRATFAFSRSDGDLPEGLGTDDPDVDEVVAIGVEDDGELFGTFEDARSERRFRPADEIEEVLTVGFSGTSVFADVWTLGYGADYTRNTRDQTRSEGRFRSDNITLDFANLGQDGGDLTIGREQFDFDDDDLDPTTPAGFPLLAVTVNGTQFGSPNETFTDSSDEFEAYYVDLQRDLTLFGRDAAIKIGGRIRNRDRAFDFTRIDYLVDTGVSLADFATTPLTDRSDLFIPFDVARDDLESTLRDIIAGGRPATEADLGNFVTILNLEQDFTAKEDVRAAYAQVTFRPLDRLEVITGVRVEETEYFTDGSAVRQLEYSDTVTEALQTALANGGVNDDLIDAFLEGREPRSVIEPRSGGNSYTEFFPSINLKWEPTDQFLFRASVSTGIKRPEFGEAAAIQFLTTEEKLDDDLFCGFVIANFGGTGDTAECPADLDDYGGVLTSAAQAQAALDGARAADLAETGTLAFETDADPARNPNLDPLTSVNYDASVSWFPNRNTVMTAAGFYKSISNFIVPIVLRGDDVTRLGFLPDDGTETSPGITLIDTFANGESATIYGVELSYYQAYTFLPGIFSGLFTQANVTFAASSAESGLVNRDFRFPDQSDVIGNLAIGLEYAGFSIRGALAYQGDRLRAINGAELDNADDDAGDILERSRTQVDINVRYDLTDDLQIYLDAQNITDAEDNRFFRGSSETLNGPLFSTLQNYGPTYQVGVRGRF